MTIRDLLDDIPSSIPPNTPGHRPHSEKVKDVLADLADRVIIDTDFLTLQDAIDATPTGATLEVRGVRSLSTAGELATVDRAMRLIGTPTAQYTQTGAGHGLAVEASGVTIQGVPILGTGSATAGLARGISAVGTAADPITDLKITGNRIDGWSMYGIYGEHWTRGEVIGNEVTDVAYGGIVILSDDHSTIERNKVTDVTMPTGFVNAYGIGVSRDTTQDLTDAPRSTGTKIHNNVVRGIPTWEGIDTHAGIGIQCTNNEVYDTNVGIAFVGGMLAGDEVHAPEHAVIVGNLIDSEVTDGSRSNGIQFIGAPDVLGTPTAYASGIITGNKIIRHGNQGNLLATSAGAIRLEATWGLVVAQNEMIEPGCFGILADNTNYGLGLHGNIVTDAWSNATAYAAPVIFRSTHQSATVSGTKVLYGTKTATQVNSRGLQIAASATVQITDGGGNGWHASATPVSGGAITTRAAVYAAAMTLGFGTVIIGTGIGSPEGVVTGGVGSTFHRTDGGAGSSYYVKESGAGNTGWIPK